MVELSNFISSQGFPIVTACGLMYGFYIVIKILVEKIILAFDTITKTNEELTRTNSILVTELRNKITNIDNKLDRVLENK